MTRGFPCRLFFSILATYAGGSAVGGIDGGLKMGPTYGLESDSPEGAKCGDQPRRSFPYSQVKEQDLQRFTHMQRAVQTTMRIGVTYKLFVGNDLRHSRGFARGQAV